MNQEFIIKQLHEWMVEFLERPDPLFWDGGLHCITSDIHREGTLKDYFPQRS